MEVARPKRWQIAAAAALMQGAVSVPYAWSVFRDPLAAASGWTISEVTLAHSLNVFCLGIFAFLGGLWMRRIGPRAIGLAAGLLYGLGLIVAGLGGDRLWALYVGFGVLGVSVEGSAGSSRWRRWLALLWRPAVRRAERRDGLPKTERNDAVSMA
jgi:MFS family permease